MPDAKELTMPDAKELTNLLPVLFTPFSAGALQLPNRIVMEPMTRSRAGSGTFPHP